MHENIFVPKKIWNHYFLRIVAVCILLFSFMQMVNVSFPLYLRDLGANAAVMGSSLSILTLVAMVSRPLVGAMADSKSRKFVMLLGLFVTLLSMAGITLLPFIVISLLCRGVQGFGLSAVTTANMAIAADVLPKDQAKQGLAYFGLCETLAGAVGPLLGLALIFGTNYLPVWLTSMIMLALAVFIILTMNYEKKKGGEEKPKAPKPKNIKEWFWHAFEKKAFPPSLMQVCMTMSNSCMFAFLAPYAEDAGIEGIGAFFTIQACAMCVSRITVGKLLDRVRTPFLIVLPAALCIMAAFLGIAFIDGVVLMAASAILFGIGVGACIATFNIMAMVSAPPERRGAAATTFYLMCDIGACIGSFAGGLIANSFGYRNLFLLLAFVPPAVVIVLSHIIFNIRAKKKQAV